jgi:hypothetical protein
MIGGDMSQLRKYVLFGIMIAVTVTMLDLLNWVPTALQKDGIRQYKTIEDAKSALKLGKLFLPSYFPQYLIWPPSEVYGRRKPNKMVLMHFVNYNRRDVILSIMQAESADPHPMKSRIEPVTIKKKETVLVKGRKGELSIALCPGGEPCNCVSWQAEGFTLTIIAKDSVQELLKIAESMISE